MKQVKLFKVGIKANKSINWSLREYASIQAALESVTASNYFASHPDAIPVFSYRVTWVKDDNTQ